MTGCRDEVDDDEAIAPPDEPCPREGAEFASSSWADALLERRMSSVTAGVMPIASAAALPPQSSSHRLRAGLGRIVPSESSTETGPCFVALLRVGVEVVVRAETLR